MTDEPKKAKPPKRWLAFLLNLIFPPAGYVYAGMPKAALICCLAFIGVFILGAIWILNFPPGPYAIGFRSHAAGIMPWQIGLPVALSVAAHAAISARPRKLLTGGKAWLAAVALYLFPLALAGACRVFGPFGLYEGASGSMLPNFREGDVLLTAGGHFRCRTPDLAAGDIITQRWHGTINIRRLVAGPGQIVEMKEGRLIIDGVPVKTEAVGHGAMNETFWRETLPNGKSYIVQDLGETPYDEFPATRVPTGLWFTLGDNRDNSLDSRTEGPTPASQICGRAIKLLYSHDKAAIGRPL